MNQQIKHFYYHETIIDRNGRVETACGLYVHNLTQINNQNPTCQECKEKKEEYDNLRIE